MSLPATGELGALLDKLSPEKQELFKKLAGQLSGKGGM